MECAQLVRETLARRAYLPLESVQQDTALGKLALDSLALVELLIELEQKYGIRFSVDDLRDLHTVGNLTARIASLSDK
jgi:acyl carrier protein